MDAPAIGNCLLVKDNDSFRRPFGVDNTIILTIDLEPWASSSLNLLSPREAALVQRHLPQKDRQVDRGIEFLLDLLAIRQDRATFFILGSTAQTHRETIRLIQSYGHEVASHSMTHRPLNRISLSELEYELVFSKKLIEDITGAEVSGFRAPYLINYPQPMDFANSLRAAGYRYDSSYTDKVARQTLSHDGFNYLWFSGEQGREVFEIPIMTISCLLWSIPLGGTYMKFLSSRFIAKVVKGNIQRGGTPVLYFHPYEIDKFPVSWPHPDPSLKARFSLFFRNFRQNCHASQIDFLLHQLRSISIRDYLKLS